MKKKNGFTLIELMVTLSITVLVTTMVGSVFIQGYKILNRTDNKSAIQDEVRNAIMKIEGEALTASKIKIRTTDAINSYNSKSAKELLYLDKVDEKIVYLEVVEDSANNTNKFVEVKLNNDNTFKEEKILINTIKGNVASNFALNSNIEDKVVNINFNNVIKENQSSGENYIVTLNLNVASDIEIEFGDESSEVTPEIPEGGKEDSEEEKDLLDKLGEHYLTISGEMEFQSNSTHVGVKGNGTLGYGSTSGNKEHFKVGAEKIFQNGIDKLGLDNLNKEELIITESWNIKNHKTYQGYNGFKIIFVNGDIHIGEKNNDNILLNNTIIIATGNVEFEKNDINLRMEDSLIYANSIKFHNKSEVIFTNTLTSQEILNRTKDKLQEMIDYYNQPLSVDFSITHSWDNGAKYKILITNNTDKDISSWQIEFDVEKEIIECWAGIVEKVADGRYKIKNQHWNGAMAKGGGIEITGSCAGGVDKIENVKTTCS